MRRERRPQFLCIRVLRASGSSPIFAHHPMKHCQWPWNRRSLSLRATYHWVYQTLVTVTEISGQPSRRFVNGFAWPCAIWEVQRLEGLVFLPWLFEHRHIGEVRRRGRLRLAEGFGEMQLWE